MGYFALKIVNDFYGFLNGFMLVAVFFVQNKIYYVHAPAVCFAIAAKAITGMGFIIHLQARRFIIMERAMQPQVFIGFQSIMLQHPGKG